MANAPKSWVTVYELAKDRRGIKLYQQATLGSPDMGLAPEPALFGSRQWWDAIRSGALKVDLAEGDDHEGLLVRTQ
jgi:hypothetical protein